MTENSSISTADLVEELPIPQKELEPPTKEPESEEDLLSKVNESIKHLEFNIEQNQKRCENTSKDTYVLLRSAERLAFDLLFANYLLGNADATDIYDFFERCTRPSYDISSGQIKELKKSSDHIYYVQSIIEKCSAALSQVDIKQPRIPKRVSEFTLFLKDQKIRLANQMARNLDPSSSKRDEIMLMFEEEEEEESDLSGLLPSFTKWLSAELKIGMSPDEESIEIRCLIRGISNRLKEISKIASSLEDLEKENIKLDESDCSQCDQDDIENSPFSNGAKNCCDYLISLLQTMQTQKRLAKRFIRSLNSCKERLASLSEASQISKQEMTNQHNKLKNIFCVKQNEAAELQKDLQPFFNAVFVSNRPNPVPPPQISFQLLEVHFQSQAIQSLNDSRLHSDLNAVYEYQTIRNELTYLSNELNKIHAQIEDKDRVILEMSMEHSKIEEELRLQDIETEQLKKYEIGLGEVQRLLRYNDMTDWCRKLMTIIESLDKISAAQQIYLRELQSTTDVAPMQQQIREKSAEIENLSATNYRMNLEAGKSTLEIAALEEEKFRAGQELATVNDFVPDIIINKQNEVQVQKHKRMSFCPICKTNRRDTILSTCKHPFCSECLYKSNHKCPTCGLEFDDSHMRPFFIQ